MSLNYNNLSVQLQHFTENLTISELHGLMSAYVCLHGSSAADNIDWSLINSLGHTDEPVSSNDNQIEQHGITLSYHDPSKGEKLLSEFTQVHQLCREICEETLAQLDTQLFEFQPLLPEGGSLYDMINEIGAWCRGFSYAMIKTLNDLHQRGGGGAVSYADLGLSSTGIEAIHDINEISQISSDTDDDEIDENIAEIEEYLRIATQTIFEEIAENRSQNNHYSDDDNSERTYH